MKNSLFLFFALVLLVSFAGCATQAGIPSPAAISSAPAQTAAPTPATAAPTASPAVTMKSPPPATPTVAPETVITFEDKELARLMKRVFGVSDAKLTKSLLNTVAVIIVTGQYVTLKTTDGAIKGDKITSLTKFGTEYEVNGKWSKEVGKLKTLNDFTQFDNLVTLDIWYQDGMDISALPKIRKLQHLTLSNCNITDISVLSQMEAMLWTLDLTNNPIADYSPLDALHFTEMHKDQWVMK
jgi:hypothetical protein